MNDKKLAQALSDILPSRNDTPSINTPSVAEQAQKGAASIKAKADAKELARLRYAEKSKIERAKEKINALNETAEKLGLDDKHVLQGMHKATLEKIAESEEKIELIEAIEAQNIDPLNPKKVAALPAASSPQSVAQNIRMAQELSSATRPEILKLLASLNINLNIQLSRSDTANLLACLLTCNEAQLVNLMNNKRIPVVIKTVIKRLMDDMRLGNIETVEKLWDRVFGKGAMQLNLPEQATQAGIIPNTPVSREAYIVIRDTLLK